MTTTCQIKRVLPGTRYRIKMVQTCWFAEEGDELVVVCIHTEIDYTRWKLEDHPKVEIIIDSMKHHQSNFNFIEGPLPLPQQEQDCRVEAALEEEFGARNRTYIVLSDVAQIALVAIVVTAIAICGGL